MAVRELTHKQEKFCLAIAQGVKPAQAYETAYSDLKNPGPTAPSVKAVNLLKKEWIQARIAELKERTLLRHDITVDSLLEELEEARIIALRSLKPQPAAAVSATMGKARLTGLDQQVVKHVNADGSNLVSAPTIIQIAAAAQPCPVSDSSEG